MEPPVYNDNEPVYIYLKKIEEYNKFLKKEKYTIILDFINNLTKKKYRALCDFKNVTTSDLKSENDLKKYFKLKGEKIGKKLNIIFDFKKKELELNDIITFINKMVKSINFAFSTKTIDKKPYYTIYNKSN